MNSRRIISGVALLLVAVLPTVALSGDTKFFRDMYVKGTATYGDGLHAVAHLVDGADPTSGHQALKASLLGWQIIDPKWEDQEGDPLTKGKLAYMICKALKIRGGVTMRILGIRSRYALRELTYKRIMKADSVWEYVAGDELVSILDRASVYQKGQ